MTEAELFSLADRTLNDVVAQIRDDQWAMEMPPTFARRPTDRTPTLREIISYHAYDDAWVPEMLAGRKIDEVGKEKHRGDLLGEDEKGSFARIVDSACVAAKDFSDYGRTVHCSVGDFSARDYLIQTTMLRGL